MSRSFVLPVMRSRRVRTVILAAHLVGAAGLTLSVSHLISSGRWLVSSVAAFAGLAAIVGSWIRIGREPSEGRLLVDETGGARWHPAGLDRTRPDASTRTTDADPQASAEVPDRFKLHPVRWFAFSGFAWIDARVGGRRLHLLLGSDQAPEADWTRLMRWLRWMDRGGGVRER